MSNDNGTWTTLNIRKTTKARLLELRTRMQKSSGKKWPNDDLLNYLINCAYKLSEMQRREREQATSPAEDRVPVRERQVS